MTITRAEAAQSAQAIRLDAGGQAVRLDLAPADGGLVAEIEPSLPIFAAFSAPDTAIALTMPDGTRMQYPTHPGIRRVFEACS